LEIEELAALIEYLPLEDSAPDKKYLELSQKIIYK